MRGSAEPPRDPTLPLAFPLGDYAADTELEAHQGTLCLDYGPLPTVIPQGETEQKARGNLSATIFKLTETT